MESSLLGGRRRCAKSSNKSSNVEGLVRKLVRQVQDETAPDVKEAGSGNKEVIVEAEIDGVRYQLVQKRPESNQTRFSLSPREQEIARMVAKGYPNKTIAGVLEISSWTVGTHLRRIFAKLGVTSRSAMVARLMEAGLQVGKA